MTSATAVNQTPEEARRLRRSSWPVRRFKLGEEPSDDLSAQTTPEERIEMVWSLTLDAWVASGMPEATPRATWPVRVRRLGTPEVD